MIKKSRIAILLTLSVAFSFGILAASSNSIFAWDQCNDCERKILRNVRQVKQILIDEVVPKLPGDCDPCDPCPP